MSEEAAFVLQVVGANGQIVGTVETPRANLESRRDWEAWQPSSPPEAMDGYLDAVQSGCTEHMFYAGKALSKFGIWRSAFAHLNGVTLDADTKEHFLEHWRRSGHEIRAGLNDDHTLLTVLSRHLPGYSGHPLVLFRGETEANITAGTYGPSWTSDLPKAAEFARSKWQGDEARAVIVAVAMPDAILACPNEESFRQGESEYVVDRRRLTSEIYKLSGFAQSGTRAIARTAVDLQCDLASLPAGGSLDRDEALGRILRDWLIGNGYLPLSKSAEQRGGDPLGI